MTKRIATLVVALAVVGLFALPARAEGPTSRPKDGPKNGPKGPGGPGGPGKALEEAIKSLNLTAEQEPKVKQILETLHQAMENFRKEHRPDANEGKEGKAREQHKAIMDNAMKQLGEVLTKEQMEKLRAAMPKPPMGGPMDMFRQLDLTDAQREKIKAIFDQTKKAVDEATTEEAKKTAREAAIAKIKSEVLTAEQAAKLEEIMKNLPKFDGKGGKDGKEGKGGGHKSKDANSTN